MSGRHLQVKMPPALDTTRCTAYIHGYGGWPAVRVRTGGWQGRDGR
jgi:hypothetical protein